MGESNLAQVLWWPSPITSYFAVDFCISAELETYGERYTHTIAAVY